MTENSRAKKRTVYLDATIFSYLYDQRPVLRFQSETTRRWWKTERPKFDVLTSRDTLEELSSGNYTHKQSTLMTAHKVKLLPFIERVVTAAGIYVQEFVMPRKLTGDAMHLAYASVYDVDYLLTWNCNHLANASKTKHIQLVNERLGLHTPWLVTPMQLFEEEKA